MRKAGFKKTVAAMLAALMVVNTMDSVLPGNPVQAAQPKRETVVQEDEKQKAEVKEITASTPSVPQELEGEVLEPEVNAYSQGTGNFSVTLNGDGYTVSYMIYVYNVKNLEPAVGGITKITKIGSTATPSATEPQWKAVRLDSNGSDDKAYFDLSFEELILRHDGPSSNSQGWSGVQVKIKFNMDKHVYQISQSVSNTENGRLCLIAPNDPKDLSLVSQMAEENNAEASGSCATINNKLNAHNGATGIVGYIQCNSYNCGLADYNGDGNYSYGKLTINFNKGKETLKINPNGGTYTKNDGQTIAGTAAKELTTKTCGSSTNINTPKRSGYTFDGWTVAHGTGGNGTYNSSTKKYTHCTASGTGTTTLKANWKKIGATNTPTPTLKPTATPIPEYVQTVEYYTWSEMEQKWQQYRGKEVYSVKKGDTFDCLSLAEKNQPEGYYISDIIAQSAGTTKWNTIERFYVVNAATIVHINYRPNKSTLQADPNGGTWNGSTEVQSFTQAYGTTLEIPEPKRDKYRFTGWNKKITNGFLDNTTYKFGPNAGVTDCITAQWEAFIFTIKYERNEPSGIDKYKIGKQQVDSESQGSIYDVGSYENAKFIGWCLAIGNWNKNTGELTSVRWLTADGTFEETETPKGEKRFDTDGYTGKVFKNLASVQELVPYVAENDEELTLVGMWTIDVDYDAEDGTNTAALTAGQHGIAPDKTFTLINEAPSLMGNEFVQWIDPTQQAINNAGKSFAETRKTMDMLAIESRLTINGENAREFSKGGIVNWGFGNDKILYATYRYYIQYQKADGTIIEKNNASRQKKFEKEYGKAANISDVTYPTNGNTEGHHYTSEKTWQVTTDNSELYKYADASNYPGKNYSNTYKQGATALVNRSVILKAVEEANTYTIKYHANNDNASTAAIQDWSKMQDQKLTYGKDMALKYVSQSLLPGYEFVGWNTKADGSGANFSNRESSTVKQFIEKAGANVNEDGAVINLYAQWKAKSYTITFDVNRPSADNNTHAASNSPVLTGTVTMEYVWDSVITNNKIGDLNIPIASLKGWHQRFSDSLWYTGYKYGAPGMAVKNGTRLGYETLGTPGNKTVYVQWEANTYYVAFGKNDKTDGGRGTVEQSSMPVQKFTYDVAQKLNKNIYTKTDQDFLYHDDEKITANERGTKHNTKFDAAYQYAWLGWTLVRTNENKDTGIQYQDEASVVNLTDEQDKTVTLYAFWNAIPNITTIRQETHFDRYEGAEITMADMREIVQAYDLEDGQFAKVNIVKVQYEDGTVIQDPQDIDYLDTTIPEAFFENKEPEDVYKKYWITYKVTDTRGMYPYYLGKKEVTYEGKILYNTPPELEEDATPSGTPAPTLTPGASDSGNGSLNGKAPKRYFFLNDTKDLSEDGILELLSRPFNQEKLISDPEDEAYEENQDDDLYIGHKESSFEIVNVATVRQNLANMTDDERKTGKEFSYIIKYKDIFGKTVDIPGDIHLVDSSKDEALPENQEQKKVRFISDKYLDTLTGDWESGEKREALEESLQKDGDHAEYKYEDQTRK